MMSKAGTSRRSAFAMVQASAGEDQSTAELPAIITAVLYAHGQKAAGKAVVSKPTARSRWLDAGREEGMQ